MALVELGFISRPHGFKGDCVIVTDTGRESALREVSVVWVGSNPENAVPRKLLSASWMPRGWKVKLEGVMSDTDVAALKGCRVYAERDALSEPPDNTFYLADLVGIQVWDVDSRERIGTFAGLESDGKGHDYWIVETASGKILVPPWKRYVAQVDTKIRRIWLRNWRDLE